MGLYDRDYYRNETSGSGRLGASGSVVCRSLIAINVAAYILQMLTLGSNEGRFEGITRWFELSPVSFFRDFQVWRLVTYAFLHNPSSPMHILFNMLGLWWFGRFVEELYGSREFLKFYLAAAGISGMCHLLMELTIGGLVPAIGASGAVMAVLMVYAIYNPRQVVYIFFVIPLELRWLVLFYVVYDLYPVLLTLAGRPAPSGVAHAAHLGGLLYGFLYHRFDLRFSRLFSGWSLVSLKRLTRTATGRSPAVRIYNPPEERSRNADLDRKVDEILAKISAQGEASLNDDERTLLKEASRRYKKT
jgi:membrane associated rhomboid family serine protease